MEGKFPYEFFRKMGEHGRNTSFFKWNFKVCKTMGGVISSQLMGVAIHVHLEWGNPHRLSQKPRSIDFMWSKEWLWLSKKIQQKHRYLRSSSCSGHDICIIYNVPSWTHCIFCLSWSFRFHLYLLQTSTPLIRFVAPEINFRFVAALPKTGNSGSFLDRGDMESGCGQHQNLCLQAFEKTSDPNGISCMIFWWLLLFY